MKPLLYKYKDLIIFLNKLKCPRKKSKLISLFNRERIDCISEIFRNFLKRNLTSNKAVIKKLKKHRDAITKVALKGTSLREKKNILTSKKGGNILAILLPLAVELASRIFSK